MTYTLIITLWIHTSHYQTPIIATAEFSSEQACRYAGAQQELTLRTGFQLNTSKYYTFTCVPKG